MMKKIEDKRKNIRESLPSSFRVFNFEYDKYDCIDALEESLETVLPNCNCEKKFYAVCHVEDESLLDNKILILT